VYGLLGPNGAGKTTLIRVLATLLRPAAGDVRVAGVDVLAEPTRARAHIGLAGQFAAVDEYQTGRENVEMVGRLYGLSAAESRRRTTDVLERIELTDAGARRVGTYSVGMRRRLDLAASLVGRPEVMFLDEPTTGIDPRNRAELWELIEDLVAGGTTVLLTTQYLEGSRPPGRPDRGDRPRPHHRGGHGCGPEGAARRGGAGGRRRQGRPGARPRAGVRCRPAAQLDDRLDPVRVPARHATRTLMTVTRALDDAGIEPTRLAVHEPTLDDVFLVLTGETTPVVPAASEETGRPGGRRRRRIPR
jgi:ABC-2 type transport system ATP-binding protein